MKIPIALAYHPDCMQHETGPHHPERPERLQSIIEHLKHTSLWSGSQQLTVPLATEEHITLIHPPSHIEAIKDAANRGFDYLDPDTVVSSHSYRAARRAIGAALAACDAVISSSSPMVAFALVRPPGHHAEPDRAMGFCLFNNIAIAARYVQQWHNVRTVAIVDWDVHHGNGTQTAFYRDPTVLYISLHQFPLYPGTGSSNEQGQGSGRGTTLNIPLPPGSGSDAYRSAFHQQVIPKLEEFQPELIMISAGYDAHRLDPLASMLLEESDFGWMAAQLWQFSISNARYPGLIFVLEGGYHLTALARSVGSTITAITRKGND